MAIAEWDAVNIDAPNAMELMRFYSALTGMPSVDPDEKWPEIGEDGRIPLVFAPVDGYRRPTWPTQERGQQMHLDISVDDLETAVAAATGFGATLADEQSGDGWRIMLDPVGHPFCLVPASEPVSGGRQGIGKWTSLTIDCPDGQQLAEFYHALLGMHLTDHGGGFFALADEAKPSIYFQPVEGYQSLTWPSQERGQQMHLDGAVESAKAIGARLADRQPGDYYRVMFDPAGHPFCLARRR